MEKWYPSRFLLKLMFPTRLPCSKSMAFEISKKEKRLKEGCWLKNSSTPEVCLSRVCACVSTSFSVIPSEKLCVPAQNIGWSWVPPQAY